MKRASNEGWKKTRNRANPLMAEVMVVPVDFSELTVRSIDCAIALPASAHTTIILVHAVEAVLGPLEAMLVAPEMQELNTRALNEAFDGVRQLQKKIEKKGFSCKSVVQFGKPWPLIVETARSIGAELIVIGTHGRSGLRHAMLGSTAERVVQHAPCSVLVVK